MHLNQRVLKRWVQNYSRDFNMILRTLCIVMIAVVIDWKSVMAQDQSIAPVYFEQDIKASDPLRTSQAKELDEYVLALKKDDARLLKLVPSDYTSPEAFEKSAQRYRQAFCDSIGYPPPGDVPTMAATFEEIGEDSLGRYFRAMIPILPGVHAEGIYIVPKLLKPGEKAAAGDLNARRRRVARGGRSTTEVPTITTWCVVGLSEATLFLRHSICSRQRDIRKMFATVPTSVCV